MRILVVVVVLLLSSLTARAEDDPRALYKRATALFALRKFSEAAALYERAFELHNEPPILYNAAQAYRLAGNKQRALDLYQSLLQIYGNGFPNVAEVNMHIKHLKRAIEADRQASTQQNNPVMADPTKPPFVYVGPQPPQPPPPGPPSVVVVAPIPVEKRPLTKRPWFWGVVGGGAAVVVGAVILGVVLGTAKTVPPNPTFGSIKGD